ncbi:MAG TPA: prephenate dehydrogenase/arogenate dehydrogenase family protein [Anaerolineaceae bacterium]
MDEPGFTDVSLRASHVAIWGLGLMGGSLAMALKGKCASLAGVDRTAAVAARAVELGIVERASTDPREILPAVDVIVLATPPRVILSTIAVLPEIVPGKTVVIDLASTKAQIAAAFSALPARIASVGGHPMCGKEKSSLENADPEIFIQAVFALVETRRTTPRARMLGEQLVRAVGSRLLWLDPAEHDRWVAATSHAPFLVASALAGATPEEVKPMIGTGFRSTTRIAASSTEMMVDILETNRQNVLEALHTIQASLANYEQLLQDGAYAALASQFRAAADHYQMLTGPSANDRGVR